ncbi:MAG: hypothetical protein II923_04490 [Campylobacter sp.]|nr:hypothetical protein [Campylobacter sp.]MBQ7271211.1 hypothetical protein [Campylobacter sp.]MBR0071277.1 hypothetical protein [Campylobacter sp.]
MNRVFSGLIIIYTTIVFGYTDYANQYGVSKEFSDELNREMDAYYDAVGSALTDALNKAPEKYHNSICTLKAITDNLLENGVIDKIGLDALYGEKFAKEDCHSYHFMDISDKEIAKITKKINDTAKEMHFNMEIDEAVNNAYAELKSELDPDVSYNLDAIKYTLRLFITEQKIAIETSDQNRANQAFDDYITTLCRGYDNACVFVPKLNLDGEIYPQDVESGIRSGTYKFYDELNNSIQKNEKSLKILTEYFELDEYVNELNKQAELEEKITMANNILYEFSKKRRENSPKIDMVQHLELYEQHQEIRKSINNMLNSMECIEYYDDKLSEIVHFLKYEKNNVTKSNIDINRVLYAYAVSKSKHRDAGCDTSIDELYKRLDITYHPIEF